MRFTERQMEREKDKPLKWWLEILRYCTITGIPVQKLNENWRQKLNWKEQKHV